MHLGSGIKAEDCGRNGVGSTEVINLSELSSPQTQRHLLYSLFSHHQHLLLYCFPPLVILYPKEVNTSYGAGRSGTN